MPGKDFFLRRLLRSQERRCITRIRSVLGAGSGNFDKSRTTDARKTGGKYEKVTKTRERELNTNTNAVAVDSRDNSDALKRRCESTVFFFFYLPNTHSNARVYMLLQVLRVTLKENLS